MNLFDDPYASEPLTVNDQGTKFWLDRATTRYAQELGLSNIAVFYIEAKDGHRTRVIVDVKSQDFLYEHQSLEAIAAHLDIIQLSRSSFDESASDRKQ